MKTIYCVRYSDQLIWPYCYRQLSNQSATEKGRGLRNYLPYQFRLSTPSSWLDCQVSAEHTRGSLLYLASMVCCVIFNPLVNKRQASGVLSTRVLSLKHWWVHRVEDLKSSQVLEQEKLRNAYRLVRALRRQQISFNSLYDMLWRYHFNNIHNLIIFSMFNNNSTNLSLQVCQKSNSL